MPSCNAVDIDYEPDVVDIVRDHPLQPVEARLVECIALCDKLVAQPPKLLRFGERVVIGDNLGFYFFARLIGGVGIRGKQNACKEHEN